MVRWNLAFDRLSELSSDLVVVVELGNRYADKQVGMACSKPRRCLKGWRKEMGEEHLVDDTEADGYVEDTNAANALMHFGLLLADTPSRKVVGAANEVQGPVVPSGLDDKWRGFEELVFACFGVYRATDPSKTLLTFEELTRVFVKHAGIASLRVNFRVPQEWKISDPDIPEVILNNAIYWAATNAILACRAFIGTGGQAEKSTAGNSAYPSIPGRIASERVLIGTLKGREDWGGRQMSAVTRLIILTMALAIERWSTIDALSGVDEGTSDAQGTAAGDPGRRPILEGLVAEVNQRRRRVVEHLIAVVDGPFFRDVPPPELDRYAAVEV